MKKFQDMTHEEKLEQAKKDDKKFAKSSKNDPFAKGEKKYGSKSKMFKESIKKVSK